MWLSTRPDNLVAQALKLRKATGRWALHSRHEENDFSLKIFVEKNLLLPLKMIVLEPVRCSLLREVAKKKLITNISCPRWFSLSPYTILSLASYSCIFEFPVLSLKISPSTDGILCKPFRPATKPSDS